MTPFEPKKTQNYSRTFGPAKTIGKQSRLPVDAAALFRELGTEQKRGPKPEQMTSGPIPGNQLDRLIGLGSFGPLPEQES